MIFFKFFTVLRRFFYFQQTINDDDLQ